jgi:hypothetical protein
MPAMTSTQNILFCLTLTVCSSLFTSCNSKQGGSKIQDSTDNSYAILRAAFLEKTIRDISLYSTVDCAAVGFGGVQSEQYKRFLLVKKIASDQELVQLTQTSNGNVKAYAFQALVDRNYSDCSSVFQQHLNDTTSFQYLSGCIGSTKFINLFYLSCLSNKLSDAAIAVYKTEISKCFDSKTWNQIEKIDTHY